MVVIRIAFTLRIKSSAIWQKDYSRSGNGIEPEKGATVLMRPNNFYAFM
jgi:hypothetical protein